MGTSGVPFSIPKSRILECIKKKKGVVTQICAELEIAFDTYAKHIRDNPELKKAIDDARNDFDTTICDMAETALMRALNQKDDLPSALSSAKFVLNNKGRSRGYCPPTVSTQPIDLDLNAISRGISEILEDTASKVIGEPGMATKPSLQDSKQRRGLGKISAKRRAKKGVS